MSKHIKTFLDSLIKIDKDNWQLYLLTNWDKIAGNLKTKVRLEKIQNNDTLILGVYDSSWMQELYLLSNMIMKKINSNLDQPRVKKIRFKCADKKYKKETVAPQKKKIIKNTTLTQRESDILKNIKDPLLSDALKNFLFRCKTTI